MAEIFKKYQKIILRTLGGLMLLVGFVIHFWSTPKEGFTRDELAAANVARMEASVAGGSATSSKVTHANDKPLFSEFKSAQKKQMEYLTILAMILGIGFLGYSFIKKET